MYIPSFASLRLSCWVHYLGLLNLTGQKFYKFYSLIVIIAVGTFLSGGNVERSRETRQHTIGTPTTGQWSIINGKLRPRILTVSAWRLGRSWGEVIANNPFVFNLVTD